MTRLCKALARLLHLWWTHDSIRIAVGEGRLLRLQPTWLVAIGEEVLEVQRRRVCPGPVVVYQCWSRTGPCQLGVSLTGVVLCREGRELPLTEGDVEVFPPR